MMPRIGLINLEPKICNTALMQISYHHKRLGDQVSWADPRDYGAYDTLYCSSLFVFTDKSQVPDNAICGGTGFDLTTKLPFDCAYDYSIYPECKTSYLWFSRGCDRNCPWCVIRQKEGVLHPVQRKPLNPKGTYITVMDNSFFANPDWRNAIKFIGRYPVNFQGVDVRTITQEQCQVLNKMRHHRQIKIAWDNPKEDLRPQINFMLRYIKAYKIMCYVLIGFSSTPEQDLFRIEELQRLKIDPFVMPYDKNNRYQKDFARWVNNKRIYRKATWKEYMDAKNRT